jgi:2,3-bisphosphoglycerate-independent phosphoglycerate mutase
VPIVFWSRDCRVDDVNAFNERAAGPGNVGRIHGLDVMPIITQMMGIQEKYGA